MTNTIFRYLKRLNSAYTPIKAAKRSMNRPVLNSKGLAASYCSTSAIRSGSTSGNCQSISGIFGKSIDIFVNYCFGS